MTLIESIKTEIIEHINDALGKKLGITSSGIVVPPNLEMGDFSYTCFEVAKSQENNPAEVAKELKEKINTNLEKKKETGFVSRVQNMGPYLNFFLDKEKLTQKTIEEIWKNKNYGNSNIGAKSKVMIEYSQPNTHKDFHVGHLRNATLGNAMVNILRANGYNTIAATYINDYGSHVAKSLWALLKRNDDLEKIEDKPAYLSEIYTWANSAVENNKEYKEEIETIQKRLESGDKELLTTWRKTKQWSLDNFNKIYDQLGIKFDVEFYESDFLKKGMKMVKSLMKKKVLVQSEGAIIVDLNEENLGVLVFVKSNGTTLYSVKDLPLAIRKVKKYRLNKSVYVVDVRQSLYFKQLFTVLKKGGYDYNFEHIDYEIVTLKEGLMSSRKGNVILYKDLREKMIEKLIKETRMRHEDWEEEKILETAEKIADGAIKFTLLKSSPNRVIVFDIDEAIDFDGFTGPYLQYTVARINSILRKAEMSEKLKEVDFSKLSTDIETGLAKSLVEFPEVVKKAAKENDPSEVSKYLFELSRNFATFYHELPVIKADVETCRARLVLIESIRRVLEKGMGLLGISVLDEM